MTSRPAARFGLKGRGTVVPGMYADLVVFDADQLLDYATYDSPRQPSAGVRYLIVNGTLVLDDDVLGAVNAGRAIP